LSAELDHRAASDRARQAPGSPAPRDAVTPLAMEQRRGHGAATGLVLVSAADPANIYGSGAPLDIDLLGGDAARLPRHASNYLVLRDGRPVLIIESHGRRVTALPWASEIDTDSALNLLTSFSGPARRILKIETYNGEPAALSPAAGRLAELGFVRDYPAMTYYAGWPATSVRS